MVKKIVIEAENGVSQEYQLWAKEAVEDFLKLFPEYKDKFEIVSRKDWHEPKYTITKEEFEKYKAMNLASIDYFVKQDDGTYLVPNLSAKWALEYAFDKKTGEINASKLVDARNEWSNFNVRQKEEYRPLSLVLTDKKLFGITDGGRRQFAFGLGSTNIGAVISTATSGNKDRFKRLIWHEFGHVFNATHAERGNVIDELGWHCTSGKNCIMAPYSPHSLEDADEKMPFCDECISSMREYISQMHGIKKEQTQEQQNSPRTTTVNSVRPQRNDNGDMSYIKKLDTFFKAAAEKRQAEYTRNEESDHYQAQIKEQNGITTNIEATSLYNLSASAMDKDGKPCVPEMETFRDMVALARSNNSIIEFGDIKTPDFKAKLMLACLEAEPPMEMDGAPTLSEEFLNSLSPDIRAALEAAAAKKEKSRKNKKEEEKPAQTEEKQPRTEPKARQEPKPKSSLSAIEESTGNRTALLAAREKLNKITPQEKAELDFYRFENKCQKALNRAKKATKSPSPREAEWEQQTGLKPENYKQFSFTRPADECWKIHLDVAPNRADQTTKEVSELLELLQVNHKIASGGENGKGMTIYAGSYQDMQKLCFELKNRFEEKISLPPLYADQTRQELPMARMATARFMVPKDSENNPIFDGAYPWPVRGLSPARIDSADSLLFLEAMGKKMGILPPETEAVSQPHMFTDAKSKYDVMLLEAYVSHELYAKTYGEFYYGKDKEKFEKRLFRDALPEAGTPERAKWDEAAEKYEQYLEEKVPERMQNFKNNVANYKRIDFRKLPPLPGMIRQNPKTR